MKTREELQELIETYENGNKSDFREKLKELKPVDIVNLIAQWQPYHSAIATLQISFEIIGDDNE